MNELHLHFDSGPPYQGILQNAGRRHLAADSSVGVGVGLSHTASSQNKECACSQLARVRADPDVNQVESRTRNAVTFHIQVCPGCNQDDA